MKRSNLKLLLNAEPFGFGPTAAIAAFFPYLREKFQYMGYLGKDHTLDLQKDLPYETVHDVSKTPTEEIHRIMRQYDFFVTALDFEMASFAQSVGLKVIIYDPLTWYWKFFPKIVKESDLYLAQDFFGVRERIQKSKDLFPNNIQIVPPIVSQKRPRISKKFTLINLGGLQNPFWSIDEVLQYAQTFVKAIKSCIPKDEDLVIATSSAIAAKLHDSRMRSYNRTEMHNILENTKYAFMTSGLGNIYDAAKFDIPTVWLPPANDSQGQQIDLLKKHEMVDTRIDWSDLGKTIDYFATQELVLKNIQDAIRTTTSTEKLETVMREVREKVCNKEGSATSVLLDTFGVGGAERIGEIVFEYCQSKE